jgi:DNA (cytosine-5)-methyltransferase 1
VNVAAHPARAPAPVNILSLCAGVGGLELGITLALDWLGRDARGVCYVEREAAAAASLVASMEAGWFHHAPVWSDLLTFDGEPWRGLVHILASGDPCQDNSVAGKRAGADGERFLAPEVVRIATECRPYIIFRENVPGNAGGHLAAIVPALEQLGYRVACGIFSSLETGNSIQRERLFIMACAKGERFGEARQYFSRSAQWASGAGESLDWAGRQRYGHANEEICAGRDGAFDAVGQLACASRARPQGQRADCNPGGRENATGYAGLHGGTSFPPAIMPGPSDDAGWRDVLDRFPEYQPALSQAEAESHLCRGINAMAYRVERLRATGNGVDPVVAATAFLSLGSCLGLFAGSIASATGEADMTAAAQWGGVA